MNKDIPLTDDEFKYIYSRVPRLCVDIVIKTKEGILLTKRSPSEAWGEMWHIPGGTVYYNETMEDAAKRIAKRELGVEVKVGQLVSYAEFPSELESRGWGWSIAFQFLCEVVSGKLKTDSQAIELKFFKDVSENTIGEHKDIIARLLTMEVLLWKSDFHS